MILFLILLVLVFVRYVLQVEFPWAILLFAVCLIALVGDRDGIIAMCVCCIPLYTSFQYIYGLAFCMILYLIKYKDEIRIGTAVLPVLLMTVWELLHCFDAHSTVMGGVRILIPLVFCTFLMFCSTGRISYPFVIRTFAVCVSFMCFVLLSKLLLEANFDITEAFTDMRRLGFDSEDVEVVGADLNPNFLGHLCILASTGLIQLRMDGRKKRTDLWMVMFMLVCGTLTLSRTFLICLALTALLLMISNGLGVKKLLSLSGQLLLVALAVVLVLILFFPAMFEELIARFRVEDITSGRLELMALFHERIVTSPEILLFGIGCQSVGAKVETVFGSEMILGTLVAHNSIQELVLCWGIPGLLMMVWFVVCLIRSAKRKNPGMGLLNLIPLIVFLVKTQAGQLISTPQNLLCFSVVYLSMCHPFKARTQKSIDSRIPAVE